MSNLPEKTPGEGARIMVVEDEGLIAISLKSMLEELGYQVPAVAASGEKAIASAWETRPDLALMDIRLEGSMDGIETAGRLRDQLDLPVIFLTAFSDKGTLEQAKSVEPLGFLVKPIQERDLYAAIEMALARREQEKQWGKAEFPLDMEAALALAERQVIQRALARTGNDVAAAASLLGIGRARIYQVLEDEGFEREG